MKTLLCLLLVACQYVSGQEIKMQVHSVEVQKEPRPAHVSVLETDTQRILTHANGQSYTLDRNDLVRFTIDLLGVKQEDGKFFYAYVVKNTGKEPINQVYFYTPRAAIWFDARGILPGESRTITFKSEYGPKKTTVHMRTFSPEKEVQRLESRPIPIDTHPELFAAIEKAGSDNVTVEIVGPLK